MLQDVRFALRVLRRQPGFAIVAILTLALGIGATTAIFTAVNAVLLTSLPFRDSGDLYRLRTALTDGRPTDGQVSPLAQTRLNALSEIVLHTSGAIRYEASFEDASGNPVQILGQGVLPRFFEVFGRPMALGRSFVADEATQGGQPAVVISHRVWQTLYGAEPEIIGRSVLVEQLSFTIVGVAAEGFNFPGGSDVWVALPINPETPVLLFDGYVRVRPGVTQARLEAALGPLSRTLQDEAPAVNRNLLLTTEPLLDNIVGPLGPTLLVIFAAAALLLVIACVNVTSLLLARGVIRAREVAVRVAMGAGGGRIFRQLLTESLVIAACGAIGGIGVAVLGQTLLLRAGASELPRLADVSVNLTVLLFAVAVTLVTGLVVGFAPALRLARTDVRSLVNEAGRGGLQGPTTRRLLNGLVVAQVTLALILSIGAALLVTSFRNLQQTDGGYSTDGRIVFSLALPMGTYQDYDRVADWYADLLDRLEATVGVTHVGSASTVPLGQELDYVSDFWLAGQAQPAPGEALRARQRAASPGFFDSMGIQLLRGRHFTSTDRRDRPGVCLVDEVFARRYFPGEDPVGKRLVTRANPEPPTNVLFTMRPAELEIVGVVRGVRYASPGVEPESTFYVPAAQYTPRRQTVVVDTALTDPTGLMAGVREAVHEADPLLPVEFFAMGALVDRALSRQRLGMTLVSLFGVGALFLAAIGIYGVMAYAVSQRRGEFAVRAAMGAEPRHLFRVVLRQGGRLALIGVGAGIAVSAAAGRVVESQLYGVSASDLTVIAGTAIALLVVGIAATAIPAARASRIDPASALRGD